MTQNQLNEIRTAYESGDIQRARALIHDALRENPTPQLYRLAAEVALNREQKDYFLEKAEQLDVTQISGYALPTLPGLGASVSCLYCGTPNSAGYVYCHSCGRSPNVKNMAVAPPPGQEVKQANNKNRIFLTIIVVVVCLWAAGLLVAGWLIVRKNDSRISAPGLTSTAFISLFLTPSEPANPTTVPTVDILPTGADLPTTSPATLPAPTPTSAPLPDIPELQAGRVTTEDYNFYNPAISPGHQAIAATIEINGNWQIVEIDPVSGLIIRTITDRNHVYTNPHYSDDGRYLLLRADISGSHDLYLVDVGTGDIIQTLTDYPESISYPRWMPDNRSFLYKRYSNADAEVYIGYLDGSPPTRLTSNDRYDGSPASSPDGRYIAMSSFIGGNYEIVLLDRNSGGTKQFTFDPGRDSEPVFSPDGAWIAFESDRGGNYNIWAIRLDGDGLKQVTFDERNELIPAFSPDGHWLYFQQRQENGNFSINRIAWP